MPCALCPALAGQALPRKLKMLGNARHRPSLHSKIRMQKYSPRLPHVKAWFIIVQDVVLRAI